MSEALALAAMLVMLGGVTHLSIEAVVSNEERNEAVAAAMRAEAVAIEMEWVANEMEWVALQAVERQDTICDCTYDLEHEPRSGGLKLAAAIHCKRCRILSVNGPSND